MNKWEYKIEWTDSFGEDYLNKFGEDGWEFVMTYLHPKNHQFTMIFKRLKITTI